MAQDNQEAISYSFQSPELPEMEPNGLGNPGLVGMGVLFIFDGKHYDEYLETVQSWYEDRDDVVLVDCGETAKEHRGFICMEWEGYACDSLFLDILHTDNTIIDYAVYEIAAAEEDA